MIGILVTGGEQPDFNLVKEYFSAKGEEAIYVCAADSGLDYCLANSIDPDYILGDMDSLSDRTRLKGFRDDIVEEHPSEKDHTDTELALMHLRQKGCRKIIMIGGGGGRLDHLMALLSLYERPSPPELWITARETIVHIDGHIEGASVPNEMVSLFPVGNEACTMSSSGLKWPLDGLCWTKGDVGISNRLRGNSFSITMKSGRLVLIRGLRLPLQSL